MTCLVRLLVCAIAAAALPAHGEDPIAVPKFEQYVTDRVGVTSAEQRRLLDILGSAFESRQNGSRVAALIVPSALPETPEQFARRVVREWQIHDGALMLIAMSERAVHIENGATRGITQAQAEIITDKIVAPMFESAKPHLSVELGLRTIMEMIEQGPQGTITIFALQEWAPVQGEGSPSQRSSKLPRAMAFVLILLLAAGSYAWWKWRRRAVLGAGGATAGETRSEAVLTWDSPSSLGIIAVNLIPVWGVVVQGWEVFPLFALFWFEILFIILGNGLRIAVAKPRSAFQVPYLWLAQGVFAMAYGIAILSIFARDEYEQIRQSEDYVVGPLRVIESLDLWPQIATLAAAHVFFLGRYVLAGEYRTADIKALEAAPAGWMIVLHLALIIGGMLAASLGSPVWALLVLVALKTGLELGLHLGQVRIWLR